MATNWPLRKRNSLAPAQTLVIACNFTPVPRPEYRISVPALGFWHEVHNSDATLYGGSGLGNLGGVAARPEPHNGQPYSILALLPPLAMVMFKLRPAVPSPP